MVRQLCVALVSLLLLSGCGGDDDDPSQTSLTVTVTIPPGSLAPAGSLLTVRVQDGRTHDDITPAVSETIGGSSATYSVVVPGVPQGAAVVARAVVSDGEAAEVLWGETAVEAVSPNTTVAITLAPLAFDSPATWMPYGPEPLYDHRNQSNVSGRGRAVLVDPSNPERIFLGAGTGGVWYSSNGGTDWKCITDAMPSNAIGSLAFDPTDPTRRTILVGTGETIPAGQYGQGIFRVTEDGQIDQVPGSEIFFGKSVSRIVALEDGTMFAGVYALVTPGFNDDGSYGVFVRRPGQSTFTNSFILSLGPLIGATTLPVADMVVRESSAPGGYPRLIAAVDNWTEGSGYASGLYGSDDGGQTWFNVFIADAEGSLLIYSYDVARISIALAPGNPDVIYALVGSYDGSFQGAFVSADFGRTWVTITTSPDVPSMVSYESSGRDVGQSRYNNTIAVDPLDAHTCYVGGTRPARISAVDFSTGQADGFELSMSAQGQPESLQDKNHPHVDHHGMLALATTSGGRTTTSLYDVSDGGAWVLPDATAAISSTPWKNINGGNTWLQTLQYYSVAVDSEDHTRLYGGAQDNGSSATVDNVYWTQVLGGDGGDAGYDPRKGIGYCTYAYSSSSLYHVARVTQDADTHYETELSKSEGLLTGEEGMFIPPLILHPVDGRLALGTVRVYESKNGGDDWTDISGKLSIEGVISAMAYHPKNPSILYAAESNTDIFRTTNGSDFEYIYETNVPELPISAIAVDANDPKGDSAWVAQSAFHAHTFPDLGQIFQTTDGGDNWTDFSGGLPDVPVWSLLQVTDLKPNILFAGTDRGVYSVVLDGKSSWTPFGTGLPTVRVRSLQVARRKQSGALFLIAGTYGRGVYQIPLTSSATRTPPSRTPAKADVPFVEQEPEEEE